MLKWHENVCEEVEMAVRYGFTGGSRGGELCPCCGYNEKFADSIPGLVGEPSRIEVCRRCGFLWLNAALPQAFQKAYREVVDNRGCLKDWEPQDSRRTF